MSLKLFLIFALSRAWYFSIRQCHPFLGRKSLVCALYADANYRQKILCAVDHPRFVYAYLILCQKSMVNILLIVFSSASSATYPLQQHMFFKYRSGLFFLLHLVKNPRACASVDKQPANFIFLNLLYLTLSTASFSDKFSEQILSSSTGTSL